MSHLLSITRRELYGLLTQRWVLILLAFMGMELLMGAGTRLNNADWFDLSNAAVTLAFLGSLSMMGLSLDAVARERSSGAMDLMLTRPVSRRSVVVGKLLAYLIVSVPVALAALLLPLALAALLGVPANFDKLPLSLVVPGSILFLWFFSAVGVAVSLFCRTLQSAFAVGGAIWVVTSPLVWQFLVMRGLQRLVSPDALAWLNVANPMGAYFSTIHFVGSFGGDPFMGPSAPTWLAYVVLGVEFALVSLFALLLFDRQEEPGYQS